MASIIVMILSILLLVVLGLVFINGKGSYFIAGFNTMSPEEQEKYDIPALCRFMGKGMFALSFSMLLWLISTVYDMNWLLITGAVLFISIVGFMLVYINTGNRFKKDDFSS